MLPNVGYLKQCIFFIAHKLNFIAIGYRRNLCMIKNHHFTKYFLKLGEVVCVCLCSEKREVNWNYFSFPWWAFTIKRKKKDPMSESSCNSVNSAIMYNIEIMIKMPFVITLISFNSNNGYSFWLISNVLLNSKSNVAAYQGHIKFRKEVPKYSQSAE